MQYKRAAGLYVAGICLILGGPLVSFIGTSFGTWFAFNNPATNMSGLFIGVAVFGGLLGIVGLFMLVAAAYRALVKIDALSVSAQVNKQSYSVDYR
jgi:uncharacterized membrane protein